MMKRILVSCTGNSCRTRMAEGFLKSFGDDIEGFSAGTNPASRVHPKAVTVMKEAGIDISSYRTKSVIEFLSRLFDFVITVCDQARETCPVFTGKISRHLHNGFRDPDEATGTEEELLSIFREIRDQIRAEFYGLYAAELRDDSGEEVGTALKV